MRLFQRGLAVVGVVAGTFAVGPAAGADQPVNDRIYTDFVRKIVIELPPMTLGAGEPRYFYGHYGAHATWGMLQGVQIRCLLGTEAYSSVNTTLDHPGDGSVRVVAVRWLFEPEVGGTYRCAMNGFAHLHGDPDKYLTVVGGDRTRLTVSAEPNPGGREWRVPLGHNPRVDYDRLSTPDREDVATPVAVAWTARPEASGIAIRTGLEVSQVSTGGGSPFVADVRLHVTQLDATGGACAPTLTAARTVAFDVHHIKIHLGLDLPIQTSGACTRTFAIRTALRYVPHPDHPQVIRHGGMVEDGVYSNTIALNA
jgi:hypothetical protein